MKICILTGRFGMGHMIAAQAIEEQIKDNRRDVEVEIIDWFEHITPKLADRGYKLFGLFVSKGYRFYNTRYRLMENRRIDQKPELFSYFKWNFKKFMEEKKPDILISTLPICSQLVSQYKERTGSSIPLITCVTDITGHSEWINKNTDFYLVGSDSVKEKFTMKGVSADKIYETGIPVRSGFTKKAPNKNENRFHNKKILIMGGGLGMLPADNGFYSDIDIIPSVEVTIITGKNVNLYHQLIGKYRNFNVLGYVNNVYDYMIQADIIITKPGGVTTFEAIFAGVPILALNPFLQQEIYNAQYIQEMSIGTVINAKDKKCSQKIADALEKEQLNMYRCNIQRIKSNLNINVLNCLLDESLQTSNRKEKVGLPISYDHIVEENEIHEKISFNI